MRNATRSLCCKFLLATVVLGVAVPGRSLYADASGQSIQDYRPHLADAQLKRIEALFDQLYFEQAERECAQALRRGRLALRQLLELLRLQGLIASASGNSDAAVDAFKRLLVLGGKPVLDPRMPPRTRDAVERAKAWVATNGQLDVSLVDFARTAGSETNGSVGVVAIAVRSDPLRMVSDAVLVLSVGGATHRFLADRSDQLRWSIPLEWFKPAREGALRYQIHVRDASANVIVELKAEQPIQRPDHQGAGPTAEPSQLRVWAWIAAGGAVASLGLGLGLRVWAGALNSEWQRDPVALGRSHSDWERLRDEGQGVEIAAYVSLGIGAVLAVGSAVLFWLEGRSSDRGSDTTTQSDRRLSLVPLDGGISWVEQF